MVSILKTSFHLIEKFSEKGHMMSVEWRRDLTSSKESQVIVEQLTSYSSNILSSHIVVSQ